MTLTFFEHVLLITSGGVAGALNSVAGGGSFLTFPSLVFVGVTPVVANATSAVALWPGQLASAVAYRSELVSAKRWVVPLSVVSAIGGLVGALLLLHTSNALFSRVIPFLLLTASLVFTFSRKLSRLRPGGPASGNPRIVIVVQAVVAVYGGYFGGGMGIVMLAMFASMGFTNIHEMNALKTILATLVNLVAIVTFIAAGAVSWRPGLVMMVATTLGGYVGAAGARRVDPEYLRRFALVIAWTMTAYFFWKASAA